MQLSLFSILQISEMPTVTGMVFVPHHPHRRGLERKLKTDLLQASDNSISVLLPP